MCKINRRVLMFFYAILSLSTKAYSQHENYSSSKIDHVLIAVDNLDSAKIEYEEYGFTVVYGGSAEKAFNALIFLSDGTVIELIGKDRLPSIYTFLNNLYITKLFGIMKDRIASFRKVPPGLFNYCLYTENLDSTYEYLKQNGLRVARPVSFSRLREDMKKVQWDLVGSFPYDLPFFINDYTPSRLSDTTYTTHANQALAIDTLVIETNNFDKYYAIYNIIYNQTPEVHKSDTIRTASYKLATQNIILQQTTRVNSFFTKKDQSAPVRFSVKCDKGADTKPTKLNDFITLTN